jgi:outer membrane protein OmpA-like peptidoglycan-associated protein
MAETHVEFTLDELDRGNFVDANEHVQVAIDAIHKAMENSKACKSQVIITKTDKDGDGVVDLSDKCPTDPEDKDGFQDEDGCPDFDNDNDGVPDYPNQEDECPNQAGSVQAKGCPDTDSDGLRNEIDKCPNKPEDNDGFQDEDGCPDPDNDNDTILDTKDKCPNKPEDKDSFQDEDGCPDPDNDNDTVLDAEDKCPNEPGPVDNPQGKGCPRKYRLVKINREKKQIEIKQKVYFRSGKWSILPRSYRLLRDVAQVLKDFPNMRVSIEGHTDSQGKDAYNLRLSERRADSVRKFLIRSGMDESRLESLGHGESKPIDSNRTRRGREANRRVEFRIITE